MFSKPAPLPGFSVFGWFWIACWVNTGNWVISFHLALLSLSEASISNPKLRLHQKQYMAGLTIFPSKSSQQDKRKVMHVVGWGVGKSDLIDIAGG